MLCLRRRNRFLANDTRATLWTRMAARRRRWNLCTLAAAQRLVKVKISSRFFVRFNVVVAVAPDYPARAVARKQLHGASEVADAAGAICTDSEDAARRLGSFCNAAAPKSPLRGTATSVPRRHDVDASLRDEVGPVSAALGCFGRDGHRARTSGLRPGTPPVDALRPRLTSRFRDGVREYSRVVAPPGHHERRSARRLLMYRRPPPPVAAATGRRCAGRRALQSRHRAAPFGRWCRCCSSVALLSRGSTCRRPCASSSSAESLAGMKKSGSTLWRTRRRQRPKRRRCSATAPEAH
eukprot:scaffold256_cov261-Pinguiococcus_pyrenoidosus.AAC.25